MLKLSNCNSPSRNSFTHVLLYEGFSSLQDFFRWTQLMIIAAGCEVTRGGVKSAWDEAEA